MNTEPESVLAQQIIDSCISHLEESVPRVERCFQQMSEEELWKDPNLNVVSPGNLILHLRGNLTQYVLSTLGGNKDQRQRSQEFKIKPGLGKDALLESYRETIQEVCQVITQLDAQVLSKIHRVQGFESTGTNILIHVVEHVSYHVGQIGYWVKVMKDCDLGYYAGQDLDVTE